MAPHSPPLPIAARLFAGALTLEVDFDRLLSPGPVDQTNWTGRANNGLWGAIPGAATAGVTMTAGVAFGLPDMGPDFVTYSPPPFDVLSDKAVPAAGFINFPLTVLP